MDWNPDFRKIGMEGLVLLVNGPDEARAAVRKLVKDGVEWVKTYPTGDAAAPDTNDHHTLCMTFEEMHAVVADGPQPRPEGHRPLPRHRGHQERPAGRLRRHRARHVHGRRGARPAAAARRARACRPCTSSRRASSAARSSACRSAVIDGHKETLEGGAESARRILQGRRPARHGRRLRLRLEPARRLRQGADLLRQVRRLHAAGSRSRCATKTGAEIMGRGHEFGTLEAGKLADVLVVDGDVLADISRAGRPLAVHRRDAGRRGQGGAADPERCDRLKG